MLLNITSLMHTPGQSQNALLKKKVDKLQWPLSILGFIRKQRLAGECGGICQSASLWVRSMFHGSRAVKWWTVVTIVWSILLALNCSLVFTFWYQLHTTQELLSLNFYRRRTGSLSLREEVLPRKMTDLWRPRMLPPEWHHALMNNH